MINTIKHLCQELRIEKDELKHILANSERYYYQVLSTKTKYGGPQKKNGVERTRTLYPSTGELKDLQKKILKNILSRLPMPDYAYGSIKGRNNILNARQHLGNRYFFSADLKSFFPSINNHMVYGALVAHNFSPDVARILTRLTTYKGTLPQGTPTSPLLSNLIFVSTGNKILELIKATNITYTSFLDDLTFSSRSNFKYLVPKILKIIRDDNYWLGHGKISYKTKDPEVTGITIKRNSMVPHHKILEKQQAENSPMLNYYINQIRLHSNR